MSGSVRDRVSRLEASSTFEPAGPELPRRLSQPPVVANNQVRSPGLVASGRLRPPVPPKAKSLGGIPVTGGRSSRSLEIRLPDPEESDEEDLLVLKHGDPFSQNRIPQNGSVLKGENLRTHEPAAMKN
ncbi:hypothetical protein LTR74_016720 [Friedmanniomyces endolithicus]|nr:hypothetical protein LTR74_016720 [Friedmanniomyces endolithicus]